jgi:tryptophan synthase beta chain
MRPGAGQWGSALAFACKFAGLAFPFLREKIAGRDIDVLACEPAACPTLSRGQLVRDGLIRVEAYLQSDVFTSAALFAGTEGIIPAPEAAHAIHGTLEAARAADEAGEERTILFNLSGHGHLDMAAYDNYFAGKLADVALDEEEIQGALRAIEGLPTPA